MAYRRKEQGKGTAVEAEKWMPPPVNTTPSPVHPRAVEMWEEFDFGDDDDLSPSSTSLAAKAIKASSAARRDSSLSSAYGINRQFPRPSTSRTIFLKESNIPQRTSAMVSEIPNQQQEGFWGSLARKAKSFLEEEEEAAETVEKSKKPEAPNLQKGISAITTSLNYIGTMVENRTADIIEETRKHIRKKNTPPDENSHTHHKTPNLELQLKASRDVAMAMAAKAKVLLRELKTLRADCAFAKERCKQVEEENRVLREHLERGGNLEDDDMIRLQLETLLSEKARLARENEVYARENRFLREVVEYHQLTMQDVIYLDEGTEEVTEVYPLKVRLDS